MKKLSLYPWQHHLWKLVENITKENAAMYLSIKTDLTDPRFEANNCSVTGPVTLQVFGISLDIPKDAHWYMSMKPSEIIQSGPFRMGCEEI